MYARNPKGREGSTVLAAGCLSSDVLATATAAVQTTATPSQPLSINTTTTSSTQRPTQSSLPPPPPPPPGFATDQLPALAPSSLMMNGLTLHDQQGTYSVNPPPPPPPGILVPPRSSPSTLSYPPLSSTATAPAAAATKHDLPRNAHATTTTTTTTANDSSSHATLDPIRLKLPPRYFVLPEQPKGSEPTTDVVLALGTLVTSTFLQLIPTGQVTEWLAHYAPTSYCSLLMGSAQVARLTTWSDKWHEWNSLSSATSTSGYHPAPSWECHGWTGQPIATTTTTCPTSSFDGNGTASRPEGGNDTQHSQQHHYQRSCTNNSNGGVLLVLTGRTIQKTERLAFTLTLLLRPASSAATLRRAYQIENDILSLSPLDPPALSSLSSSSSLPPSSSSQTQPR